uniref:Uncharacterized protein n=1 Tax=Prymnesium polylepis TaxID=72548 RepID=A0A7S4M3Y3_9EUKA
MRGISLKFLRSTRTSKRFRAVLKIQRAYRTHRARRLRREQRKVGAMKSARKRLAGGLAACYVSEAHQQMMQELARYSQQKRLLEQGELVADV